MNTKREILKYMIKYKNHKLTIHTFNVGARTYDWDNYTDELVAELVYEGYLVLERIYYTPTKKIYQDFPEDYI